MAEALGAAELRELIRHIMKDGFNQADMAMVHASFHPDYRRHGFGGPVTHGGPRHWQNPPVPPHTIEDGATLLVDRRSQWVAFGGEWAETDDFTDMGEAFMAAHPP
ncbi:MAG: hypothetical protein OEY41_12905, partial [Acidimicrobiia bacterium]|nr:hypothetical protein [Acidimicrobiia bacterium]